MKIRIKDKRKNYIINPKELNSNQCAWCLEKVDYLIYHHYPIPRKDNGKYGIKICPRCHQIYHGLGIIVDARNCKTKKEIKQKEIEALKQTFPNLKRIVNPPLLVLNPKWLWHKVEC